MGIMSLVSKRVQVLSELDFIPGAVVLQLKQVALESLISLWLLREVINKSQKLAVVTHYFPPHFIEKFMQLSRLSNSIFTHSLPTTPLDGR
jgi:hypothetical protein